MTTAEQKARKISEDLVTENLLKEENKMSKYLVADANFLAQEDLEREIKEAAKYETAEEYADSSCWEDWMEEFTDAPDGEQPSEDELRVIREVQEEIWEMAQ